jgi:hypothetical protein
MQCMGAASRPVVCASAKRAPAAAMLTMSPAGTAWWGAQHGFAVWKLGLRVWGSGFRV